MYTAYDINPWYLIMPPSKKRGHIVLLMSVSLSVCIASKQFFQTTSPLKLLIGFWPNLTGMIPGWSPTKVVQTVPVGCLSRSWGHKIGFQNAIFKNLVWNLVSNYSNGSDW